MQRYLGKQKKDKRPLIRSAPPPTLSFCRLQSLVSRWQLKGVDSWIHRDLFIPKGTLSPPRASCLSAPHSILGDSQAVRSPLCLTHPARLSYPTPITPAGSGKGVLFLLATSLTCPTARPRTEQDSPHMNHPQRARKHTWHKARAAGLRCTSACGSEDLHCWRKFHSTDQKLFQ